MPETSWTTIALVLLFCGVNSATILLVQSMDARDRALASTLGFLALMLTLGYWLIVHHDALTERRVGSFVTLLAATATIVALLLRLAWLALRWR